MVSLIKHLEYDEAAAPNVQIVNVVLLFVISYLDVFKSFADMTLLEGAPGEVLVYLVEGLAVTECELIVVFSLLEISLQLIENSDFEISINSAF